MGGNHTYTHGGWIKFELVRRRSDPLMDTESWRLATSGSKVVGAETRGRRGCDPAGVMGGCVEVVRIECRGRGGQERTRHEQTFGISSDAVPRVVCCTEMCRLE